MIGGFLKREIGRWLSVIGHFGEAVASGHGKYHRSSSLSYVIPNDQRPMTDNQRSIADLPHRRGSRDTVIDNPSDLRSHVLSVNDPINEAGLQDELARLKFCRECFLHG